MSSRSRWAIAPQVLVLVLASRCGVARGEEVLTLHPPGWADEGAGPESRRHQPAVERAAPPIDHRSVVLDLGRISAFARGRILDGFLGEVAPENERVVYDFSGIQCVAYRYLMGYYKQMFQSELLDQWSTGRMTIMDLDRHYADFANGLNDVRFGVWWDRSWRDSLPVEKGGASTLPRRIEIGRVIEVFRVGELALTNEGAVCVGALPINFDSDRIYSNVPSARALENSTANAAVRRDPATATRDVAHKVELPESEPAGYGVSAIEDTHLARFVEDEVRLDLERVLHGSARARYRRTLEEWLKAPTPTGNIYTGDGWNLVGRLTVIPQASVSTPLSYASGMLDLNFYPGFARDHFAALSLRLKGQPGVGANFQLQLEVFGW